MNTYRLVYKDLRLSIHPFFFILPLLTSALFLIPKWPYFIALMYFFWISVPTITSTFNSQNDFGFSVTMPVKKRDVVGGKLLSFALIELLHLIFGAIFALIRAKVWGMDNFLLDPNLAFFGFAFVMFGLFNLAFFPIYFQTAYRFGVPTIVGTVVTLAFATGIEALLIYAPTTRKVLEGLSQNLGLVRLGILVCGVLLFAGLSFLAFLLSIRQFEKVDF